MSKQVRTLTRIATAIVSHVNAQTALTAERATLLKQAQTLAPTEKAKIDAELVNYYAVQASVPVKAREKGEAAEGRCSLVAVWARDEEKKLTTKSNAASVALSRARSILFGVEKGKAKKAPQASNEAVFDKLEKMAALAVSGGDKAQIKALKQRVTAVMLMLSA
jgi:hypothetical protein